jgi:hypothetical protein
MLNNNKKQKNLEKYLPSVGEKPSSTIAKYNFSRTTRSVLYLSEGGLK